MATVPLEQVLIIAGVLFIIGGVGVLIRRDILFILISIEIMLNAAGLAFIAAGSRWAQADGQVLFMIILAVAGSEVPVALALIIQLYRRLKTVDIDQASQMHG